METVTLLASTCIKVPIFLASEGTAVPVVDQAPTITLYLASSTQKQ